MFTLLIKLLLLSSSTFNEKTCKDVLTLPHQHQQQQQQQQQQQSQL